MVQTRLRFLKVTFVVFICVYVSIRVKVRRQLVGVASLLLPCGTQTELKAVALGSVYLHPLSSLVSPEILSWQTKIQTQPPAAGNKIKTLKVIYT